MMKKSVNKGMAAVMAAAMMMSVCSMSAMATELTTKSSDSTLVKYSVTESYTWSVPTEIDFTGNGTVTTSGTSGKTQNVQVTKNIIGAGKKLKITAAGSGTSKAFTIQAQGNSEPLTYTITVSGNNDALEVDGEVLSVDAGTNEGSAELTFKLTKDSVEKAGDYVGSVAYTAAVVNQ